MALKPDRARIFSQIGRFITAGGLTLAVALVQELFKPDPDWTLIATIIAGLLVGLCGGAYRHINRSGPMSSIPPR